MTADTPKETTVEADRIAAAELRAVAFALAQAYDDQRDSPTKAVTAMHAGVDMTIDYWQNMARAAIKAHRLAHSAPDATAMREALERVGLALNAFIGLIDCTEHGEDTFGPPYLWTRAPTNEEAQEAMAAANAAADLLFGKPPHRAALASSPRADGVGETKLGEHRVSRQVALDYWIGAYGGLQPFIAFLKDVAKAASNVEAAREELNRAGHVIELLALTPPPVAGVAEND